jgi:hypothetical protein
MMNVPFHWVGRTLGVLIQSIPLVGHYETNIHKSFPATKRQ